MEKSNIGRAVSSIIVGEAALVIVYVFGSPFPFGPATTGFILGVLTFIIVSTVTTDSNAKEQNEHHRDLVETYFPGEAKWKEDYSEETKSV